MPWFVTHTSVPATAMLLGPLKANEPPLNVLTQAPEAVATSVSEFPW